MTGKRKRGALRLSLLYLASLVVAVLILGPILWLISASLQPETNLLSVHTHWIPNPIDLTSYRQIIFGAFGGSAQGAPYQARIFLHSLLNSLIVAMFVAFLSVVIGSYAAYALARLQFRARTALLFSILGSRLIPALALAVPFYMIAKSIGMLNNLGTLIITDLSFNLPYVIWLLRAYFSSIPYELEDAGRIDGCTRAQVVSKIIIPVARPGLVSAGILAFLMTWGEFFFALILTSSEAAYTNTVVAAMFATDVDVKYTQILTAGVLSIILPVTVALIFQRYIVRGLTAGSVKG